MTDNVTLPGAGSLVETREQENGSQRQVIVLGEVETAALLSALKTIAHPLWLDQVTGNLRVNVQTVNSGTITTVSTVGTVNTVNALNSRSTDQLFLDNMQSIWAATVRGQIT